jgi:FtsP/CotA-like multicopper oxidase with cupredoxin domain
MILYPFGKISATKGKLHFTDPRSRNMTIPPGSVVVGDGFSRIVTTVNGQIPGPPIIVTEGQEVIVHVKNELTVETVTIHWHGMHMVNNTWNDGANLGGQCPIAPGQSFTYRFKADPAGTHWYHSHVHGQRVDGLYGAIIVKPRKIPRMMKAKDAIMQVTDWWHQGATETHFRLSNMDYFTSPGFKMSHLPNGVLLQALDYYSVLIEGLGRWMDDPREGTPVETPRKIYTIKGGEHLGEHLRFRIINAGNVLPLRISVDGHPLLLVASDGMEIKPILVESVIVSPGERYDVIIRSRYGKPGNYWVRAASLHNPKLEGLSILRYKGAPAVEPTTKRNPCKRHRCLVVNCIFNYFPKNRNLRCVPIDRLRNANRTPLIGLGHEKEIEEHWYNFGTTLTHAWGYQMWVNGKVHKNHYSDLLHKNNLKAHHAGSCSREECTGKNKVPGKPCPCFNMVTLKGDNIIQMVIASVGTDPHPLNHPIHLHGYSFQVLKIGYPPQDPKTGMKKGINPDIECVDKSCFKLRWTDKKFTPEYFSKLNPNPIKKDTVYIPTGGYAVVRFFANNPGRWLMHCHIDFDAKDGMAMAFNVAPEKIGPQPPGSPKCTTFFNDPVHHPEKTCKK